MMTLAERIEALDTLGKSLDTGSDDFLFVAHKSLYENGWFVIDNIRLAVSAVIENFLDADKLKLWLAGYELKKLKSSKTVALILAGNIPMVGFHDILCCFICGHKSQIKLSDKDKLLIPYFIEKLQAIDSRTQRYFEFVDKVKDFDAVIATGSNNSAMYFETYFGKYPHVIRKNRNAVAILDGSESKEELRGLASDVLTYFGLGCRNVSKLYVPKGYDFVPLMEVLHEYNEIILHSKYKNNFDYNFAIYMMNKTEFLNNGCVIVKEDEAIVSRIACLHYSYYEDLDRLSIDLLARMNEIQCICSNIKIEQMPQMIKLGKAQNPGLSDYADGVDTLMFLQNL